MNIVNILYNNGELNWDALSTISNIILVLALVVITWWYARQVRRQTILMEKDRKKNKILEGIQTVLNPFIEKIDEEINTIKEDKSFSYSTQRVFGQHFHQFFNCEALYSGTFWDIIGKSPLSKPLLKYNLRSNDKLSDKVNELYTKIERELTTKLERDRFNECLKEWLTKYNQSNHNALGDDKRVLPDLEALCKDYIISNWDLNNVLRAGSEVKSKFLKEYKSELLKYRDILWMKELLKEIGDTLNKFKKSEGKILKRFKEIKEEYRKEYHFCEEDLNIGVRNLRTLQKTIGHWQNR